MGRFLVFLTLLLDLAGATLTFFYGAAIIPNVLWLLLFLLDNSGRLIEFLGGGLLARLPRIPILTFPTLFAWDAWHLTWGAIWLGLYLVLRVRSALQSPFLQRQAPANRLHSGEARDLLLQQCIHGYEQALTRFVHPPIDLVVPPIVEYERREALDIITWRGSTPILPLGLLTPEMSSFLATMFALELAQYNSADLFIRTFFSTYPYQQEPGCLLTGVFLDLPTYIPRSRWFKRWSYKRVLEYDTFAWYVGQGEGVLQILYAKARKGLRMQPTEYEPGTLERIGHLLALLRQEYAEMGALGLPTPPLPEIQQSELALLMQPEESLTGQKARKN